MNDAVRDARVFVERNSSELDGVGKMVDEIKSAAEQVRKNQIAQHVHMD
jgi:hypothetical protein